jgi:hypothetical protein
MASKDQKVARAKATRALLVARKTAPAKGYKAPAFGDFGVGDTVAFINLSEPFKGVQGVVHRTGSEVTSAIHVQLPMITTETEDGKSITKRQMIEGHCHFAALPEMLRIVEKAPAKKAAETETAAA